MSTRDVSKDVANVVEFYRLVGVAMATVDDTGDGGDSIETTFDFLGLLDTRELAMLIRGLTYSITCVLTPDSQITPPGSTDPEDLLADVLVRLVRLGDQQAGQLLTIMVVEEPGPLAFMVATTLAIPIAQLVQSGQITLDGLIGKGGMN